MSILSAPYFQDEALAYAKLESIVWPDGPICPHCGATDRINTITGKSARMGLKFCGHCRTQFTVKVGTVFESSHIPLHKWLQAVFLFASSKKGFSAHQLHRVLEVTYKTAWFMAHRVREAMTDGNSGPLGGSGISVEADETFIGRTAKARKRDKRFPYSTKFHGSGDKMKVLSLVERGGPVRSFKVDKVNSSTVQDILFRNVSHKSGLLTDEAGYYKAAGTAFASHESVNHSRKEYARGIGIHVNTLEGYFSIFKRGMKGIYQHCSEKHLHRYLAEFDFRYNNRAALKVSDLIRTEAALKGIVGKRVTYRAGIGSKFDAT